MNSSSGIGGLSPFFLFNFNIRFKIRAMSVIIFLNNNIHANKFFYNPLNFNKKINFCSTNWVNADNFCQMILLFHKSCLFCSLSYFCIYPKLVKCFENQREYFYIINSMKSWKDNISFILIEPREPGNIGSSARALKNMGFKNIELVKPVHFFTVEARFMACDAVDVLEQAIVHSDLKDAIKDKSLVIGTTRRLGKQRGLIIPVKESIKRIIQTAKKNRVAILFGREDKGLSNKEVEKCGFLITIPTNSSSPSLNLAQSILLVAYELSQKEYTGTIPAIIKLEELENF